jgi:hypothetical protein
MFIYKGEFIKDDNEEIDEDEEIDEETLDFGFFSFLVLNKGFETGIDL